MKKTVLSLAFVLSISLAFGAEIKPVTNESKVVNSNKEVAITKKEAVTQTKTVTELVCSQGKMCDQYYAACAKNSYVLSAMLTELAILLCGKPGGNGEEGDN